MYTVFTYHGTVEGFFTGINGYTGPCYGHTGRDFQFTRFVMHTGFTDHGVAEDFLPDIDGCTGFYRGLTGRDSGFTKFVIHAGPWEQRRAPPERRESGERRPCGAKAKPDAAATAAWRRPHSSEQRGRDHALVARDQAEKRTSAAAFGVENVKGL